MNSYHIRREHVMILFGMFVTRFWRQKAVIEFFLLAEYTELYCFCIIESLISSNILSHSKRVRDDFLSRVWKEHWITFLKNTDSFRITILLHCFILVRLESLFPSLLTTKDTNSTFLLDQLSEFIVKIKKEQSCLLTGKCFKNKNVNNLLHAKITKEENCFLAEKWFQD